MTAGQETVKFLKPAGCILVLLLTVAVMYSLFSATRPPISGYVAPNSSEYYAEHLDELKLELETNVFPQVGGIAACEISGDTLTIYFKHKDHVIERAAILRYYDESLFTFSDTIK